MTSQALVLRYVTYLLFLSTSPMNTDAYLVISIAMTPALASRLYYRPDFSMALLNPQREHSNGELDANKPRNLMLQPSHFPEFCLRPFFSMPEIQRFRAWNIPAYAYI